MCLLKIKSLYFWRDLGNGKIKNKAPVVTIYY